MLIKLIMIISALLSLVGFLIGTLKGIKSVLKVFMLSVVSMIALWFVICFIVTRFVNFNVNYTKHSALYWWFTYCVVETGIQIFRVKLIVNGADKLPKEKFMLVCNHRSFADPLIIMKELKKYKMAFIARHEVYRVPLLSRLMHRCNCYCLNRDDIKEGAKTIFKAADCIKEDRASMGVFPEGTRNRTEEEMLPFMNGAFKIAKKAECPIVVATLKNTGEIHKRAPFRKTTIYLDYIEVLDKEFVSEHNTVQLGNKAREIMENNLATYA